ncbi:MAG: hypothetical protein AAB634_01520 [Patescibacteria group bacterium]
MLQTTTERQKLLYPLIQKAERLLLLRNIKGMWKHKKPDPIKELQKLRKERERDLLPSER